MKIDSNFEFKRIIVGKSRLDGSFRIVKGSGDLSGELFVVGVIHLRRDNDGTIMQEVEIVYPYREVTSLLPHIPVLEVNQQKETL